ncbi:ATP-binding cassette domain-containing protein [Candidatus Bathyarchaeota archaeon]|nr:ATP-binding cassette domain-containing protein [Candidatus Bathyarchaeota archaeon]
METYEITVEGLRYQYGKNKAVNDISFKVKKGEIFSFLGPNGAGKTTTINVLTTLLPIQKGKISISGFDLRTQPDEIRKSIGIVFQNETLDWNLTVEETLEFHGRLYAIPKKTRKDRINELIQIVKLEEKRDEFVKNLSGGMKRKLEIARGLLTRPKVLFLDEPTIGLDPNSRMRIWNYIKRVNKEGVTIFLTTHYMDEADQLSDNICIIDRGKIIVNGFSEVLKQSLGMDVIYLKTDQDEKAFKTIKNMREIKNIRKAPSELMISVEDGQKNMPRLIEQIRIQGIEIKSIYLKKPTLDDVFIHYTGRHFREEEQEKKKKIIT